MLTFRGLFRRIEQFSAQREKKRSENRLGQDISTQFSSGGIDKLDQLVINLLAHVLVTNMNMSRTAGFTESILSKKNSGLVILLNRNGTLGKSELVKETSQPN